MAATQTTKRNGKLARHNGRPAVKMADARSAGADLEKMLAKIPDKVKTRIKSKYRNPLTTADPRGSADDAMNKTLELLPQESKALLSIHSPADLATQWLVAMARRDAWALHDAVKYLTKWRPGYEIIELTRLPDLEREAKRAAEIQNLFPKLRTRLLAVKRLLSSNIDNPKGYLELEDEVIEPAAELMLEACELFTRLHEASQLMGGTVSVLAERAAEKAQAKA